MKFVVTSWMFLCYDVLPRESLNVMYLDNIVFLCYVNKTWEKLFGEASVGEIICKLLSTWRKWSSVCYVHHHFLKLSFTSVVQCLHHASTCTHTLSGENWDNAPLLKNNGALEQNIIWLMNRLSNLGRTAIKYGKNIFWMREWQTLNKATIVC